MHHVCIVFSEASMHYIWPEFLGLMHDYLRHHDMGLVDRIGFDDHWQYGTEDFQSARDFLADWLRRQPWPVPEAVNHEGIGLHSVERITEAMGKSLSAVPDILWRYTESGPTQTMQ